MTHNPCIFCGCHPDPSMGIIQIWSIHGSPYVSHACSYSLSKTPQIISFLTYLKLHCVSDIVVRAIPFPFSLSTLFLAMSTGSTNSLRYVNSHHVLCCSAALLIQPSEHFVTNMSKHIIFCGCLASIMQLGYLAHVICVQENCHN
jgi:hypothetical protein